MRFKVDENLPAEVAALLRSAGHDADTVGEEGMSGAADDRVAEICRLERRVLVTLDTDFANVLAYPPDRMPGIIVLRLARQDKSATVSAMTRVIPLLALEPLEKKLWIVDDRKVRMRG